MVAWPPSGPTTVVILAVDYISELPIHSLYVHPFRVKESTRLHLFRGGNFIFILSGMEIVDQKR